MSGSQKILEQIMMNMVAIPEGSFLMGANNGERDERPVHNVLIDGFYLSKYVVTQEEWFQLMGTAPWQEMKYVKMGSFFPVVNISWYDTKRYIKLLTKLTKRPFRLPTEAEWEYACRGGRSTTPLDKFHRMNLGKFAWYYDNAFKKGEMYPHEIGRKNANKFGLHDMLGNVYEWCLDWYQEDYYNQSPISNPQGPKYGSFRIVRGGDWARTGYFLRLSSRRSYSPHFKDSYVGFRLAMSKDEQND